MKLNDIATLGKSLEKFTIDNSPTILTAIGAAGTLTTAILTHRATFKATLLMTERDSVKKMKGESPLTRNEIIKLTWTCYIPPVAVGVGTIAAIIGANQISNRRAAAMAAAYSLSQHAFEEYKDKVVEKVGKTKERAVRDDIAQDRVNQNPPSKNDIIITGGGDVLCYDKYTGRYFMSNMDALKKAENQVNFYVLNNQYATLNDFYQYIGLPTVPVGEEVGWTCDLNFGIDFSTTIAENDKPCIVLDYQVCGVRRRPSNPGLKAVNDFRDDGHPLN